MIVAPALPMLSLKGPSLSDRLALIIQGLCQAVAARGAGDRAIAPLLLLVSSRLRRAVARFERLVARLRAGCLPIASRPAQAPRLRAAAASTTLPRGFAWLVRLLPEAAVYGSQLQHLLDAPEMAALLAAAPQAGRVLRPLCQMLAIRPGPALRDPPRRTRPAADAPVSGADETGGEPGKPTRPSAQADQGAQAFVTAEMAAGPTGFGSGRFRLSANTPEARPNRFDLASKTRPPARS